MKKKKRNISLSSALFIYILENIYIVFVNFNPQNADLQLFYPSRIEVELQALRFQEVHASVLMAQSLQAKLRQCSFQMGDCEQGPKLCNTHGHALTFLVMWSNWRIYTNRVLIVA